MILLSILLSVALVTGSADGRYHSNPVIKGNILQTDGKEIEFERAVLTLTGAGEMEELEESVVEVYEELRRNPLKINSCGRSRLLSCGMFSRYQVASLTDYRRRCGDVLSLTELGAIDGFGAEFAAALSSFVSFEGSAGSKRNGIRQSVTVKASGRTDGTSVGACGALKYHAEFGERVELNWCDRNTYSKPQIGPGTINAAYYGQKWLGKVIAGDYNARFGQGLLMWTGFSLSGVTSARSMWRNGTGFSTSKSFSGTCHGLAADFLFGRWSVSAGLDVGTGLPRGIVNFNRTGKVWQAGMTGVMEQGRYAASLDFRVGFNGGAVFGEAAVERRDIEDDNPVTAICLAFLAGAFWMPAYDVTLSMSVRAYPKSFSGLTSGALRSSTKVSDEYGLSLAFQNKWSVITADAVKHLSKGSRQVKLLTCLKPSFEAGKILLNPSLRGSWKCGVAADGVVTHRYDIRAEMDVGIDKFKISGRFNTVHSEAWSWMGYIELGWKGKVTLWLRGGIFMVDNWEDRIYVYERDAPGNFNVPVLYGRGWNSSAVAGVKIGTRHGLWLRASVIDYPWTNEKKGRWELKLQYILSISSPLRKIARE